MSAAAPVTGVHTRFAQIATRLAVGREAIWTPAAVMFVAGVPFAAFTGLTLYHFYVKGAFFWDSGLLAYLMSATDPRLPTPAIFGGESFFATHFTPIFLLLSLIRRALPLTDAQFFAGFCGVCHALPGLATFWLMYSAFRLRGALGIAIAATVSVAFSFNGLALAIARYPHFEMLMVSTALLSFVALIRGRPVAASLFFTACLAVREDAGFHLFGILFLLILLNRYRGMAWRDQRREVLFAVVALAYSTAVLALQHAVFGGHSSFARIYLGEPAFANLSPGSIGERLLGYAQYRTYLVLPAIVALFWAARTRNPYIVLGYAAFLPWALLHLIADSDLAGTLSGYYAFPFMIAAFWPLLGVLYAERTGEGDKQPAAVSVLAFAAMIAVSFTAISRQHNPGGLAFPADLLSPPTFARQRATEHAITVLTRSKAELGAVVADGSVLALAPNAYRSDQTVRDVGSRRPDTVIYFDQGYEAGRAREIAAAARLQNDYQVPGTSIRLASDRRIDPASPLGVLVAPVEPGR